MSRVSKLHPRVEAYGTVDELNATIGVALVQPGLPPRFAGWLRRIQNDLLDVGADLSVPGAGEGEPQKTGRQATPRPRLRISAAYTEWLEGACDEVNAGLEPLRSFVIPGGNAAAAHLHVCRTVCRRAERRALAVGEAQEGSAGENVAGAGTAGEGTPEVVRYLNRLSDLLFILSRAVNEQAESPVGARRARRPPGRLSSPLAAARGGRRSVRLAGAARWRAGS